MHSIHIAEPLNSNNSHMLMRKDYFVLYKQNIHMVYFLTCVIRTVRWCLSCIDERPGKRGGNINGYNQSIRTRTNKNGFACS